MENANEYNWEQILVEKRKKDQEAFFKELATTRKIKRELRCISTVFLVVAGIIWIKGVHWPVNPDDILTQMIVFSCFSALALLFFLYSIGCSYPEDPAVAGDSYESPGCTYSYEILTKNLEGLDNSEGSTKLLKSAVKDLLEKQNGVIQNYQFYWLYYKISSEKEKQRVLNVGKNLLAVTTITTESVTS